MRDFIRKIIILYSEILFILQNTEESKYQNSKILSGQRVYGFGNLRVSNSIRNNFYFRWFRRPNGYPEGRQEVSVGRRHIVGYWMCGAKSAWSLYKNQWIQRLDQSNSTVLNQFNHLKCIWIPSKYRLWYSKYWQLNNERSVKC